jgi:hypothetical protein
VIEQRAPALRFPGRVGSRGDVTDARGIAQRAVHAPHDALIELGARADLDGAVIAAAAPDAGGERLHHLPFHRTRQEVEHGGEIVGVHE